MAQPITDQVGFLAEACRAVQELTASKESLEQFRQEEKRLAKELDSEQKAVSDEITLTVRKRAEEINDTYDKEIGKAQDRLKRARSKRERAKNQGMKERIHEETQELNEENRELQMQMKTLFQQERIPKFCKSTLYFSLYLPRGFSEFSVLLLVILFCFLAVPFGIYTLLPVQSPYCLMAIYFAAIVVFGGLYIFINNKTKVRHQKALKQGRAIRDLMKSNNKKIRVIVNSIRRDRNEAVYDLKKYDDEIARIQQELSDIMNKKKEALNTFDKVTKTIISDEIAEGRREELDRLKMAHDKVLDDVGEAEIRVKEQTLFIADHYESYLGKEFMIPEKLDELADMIRMGKASTINEARNLYREMKG
ncbi:MAG TPA: hypothetical protein H9740_07735 [Candidatus Hungatella pullicola]|nr:hypothetical protein [Candidatus Hungatella pullicola]